MNYKLITDVIDLIAPDYRVYHPDYGNFLQQEYIAIPSLEKNGFEKTDLTFEFPKLDERIVRAYDTWRDYPAKEGTTRLGMALRFGTISIRFEHTFARNRALEMYGRALQET